MTCNIKKLNLKRYQILNNIKEDLTEDELFLHWLRYRKQDVVFIPNQIYISQDLFHFDRIKKLYNLHDYYSREKPALFFGIYNNEDLETVMKHNGDRYIIWGGTDCDIRFAKHREIVSKMISIPVLKHYAISENIKERLRKIGLPCQKLELNLTHTEYFKPLKRKGSNIYIYNGYEKGHEHIYGEEEYTYIVQKLEKFMFIFSHGLKLPYTKMANLYEKCFIGLRLTKHDGSANTVIEMQKMGLKIVHNGEFNNTLSWKNTQDIITHIHTEYFKKEEVKFNKLDFNNLDLVMNDVERIDKYIKKYKTILFICSDYPGWGGAATNCYELIKYYKKQGLKVYGIFWCWSEKEYKQIKTSHYDEKLMSNIIFTTKSKLKNVIIKLDVKPELVILRNMIYEDIQNFYSCPIFLFVPGLFNSRLDKDYKKLQSKNKLLKYTNKQLFKTLLSVDMILVNSIDTQKILKKYFNMNSILFYFNLIPYINKTPFKDSNFEKRPYDYGIIVSDCTRKVKNIPEIIKNINGKTLLIGKNSNRYSSAQIDCLDLISHKQIQEELKKIKKVIVRSHYEGCSNVLVEAHFAGCKI